MQAVDARPARRSSRGVALVEFALILPLVALVVFGTIDMGRAYSLKNRLKNAAREGALYAQTHPLQLIEEVGECADPDNAEYHALNELDAAGDALTGPYTVSFVLEDPSDTIDCEVLNDSLDAGSPLRVRVQADFGLVTPMLDTWFSDGITITETVEVIVQGTEDSP